jgi:hypothetical protein
MPVEREKSFKADSLEIIWIRAASSSGGQGYQILGPYPCDKSFFKYCKSDVANGNTGSTIYVGAPIGTAAALTALLTGKATPPLNECGTE